jgi:hypothetical protein
VADEPFPFFPKSLTNLASSFSICCCIRRDSYLGAQHALYLEFRAGLPELSSVAVAEPV